MKIILSGASGFVGTALVEDLRSRGAEVLTLVRRPAKPNGNERRWAPDRGELEPDIISGADAVINLNGRSIADGRWTSTVKAQLRSSRLESTRTIVEAIGRAEQPPALLINASATGFYGDRGGERLDETSDPGDGFLADLTVDWENAAAEAASPRTRVVCLRLGMVLGDGGALDRMLTPFKLGLGGPMGNGRQFWPWITIADVAGAVGHTLATSEVDGPVNLVTPEPVTSKGFARALGKHLGVPAVVPAPAFAVKLALGEMAEELLLASAKVHPGVLSDTGYEFRAPTLAQAFRQILG
ncbi:MAG: TIGR01777 family oxidoreductase [Thermoanaerobaculales bacterium]|jgi:uncharacterized protein (TIGR01777 family)|nr:TIGR01777 family oxidoreductase [Thermoanaerobaculales bacterium]